jgi:glutamate:Na+ symporter, ESS family
LPPNGGNGQVPATLCALAVSRHRHSANPVTFPAVGRDDESAIISGAFCGFAMGATATAIANMQALTRRHGPAPQAFVVVPIVGAFFIDLMNLAVLTFFLLPGLVVSGK